MNLHIRYRVPIWSSTFSILPSVPQSNHIAWWSPDSLNAVSSSYSPLFHSASQSHSTKCLLRVSASCIGPGAVPKLFCQAHYWPNDRLHIVCRCIPTVPTRPTGTIPRCWTNRKISSVGRWANTLNLLLFTVKSCCLRARDEKIYRLIHPWKTTKDIESAADDLLKFLEAYFFKSLDYILLCNPLHMIIHLLDLNNLLNILYGNLIEDIRLFKD